jgi:hypothetical protein
VGCGVWSVECGVWSVECGVWGVGCGVWGVECGVCAIGYRVLVSIVVMVRFWVENGGALPHLVIEYIGGVMTNGAQAIDERV